MLRNRFLRRCDEKRVGLAARTRLFLPCFFGACINLRDTFARFGETGGERTTMFTGPIFVPSGSGSPKVSL